MRDVTLGQFYPAESFTHKLDPRVKIIATLTYIVGIFLIKNTLAYAAAISYCLITILVSRIPLKSVLKSVKGIIFIVIFTAVFNLIFYAQGNVFWSWWKFSLTDEGLVFSAKMALRLILLVTGTTLLTYTTTPTAITDGTESLMYPLKLIKVPVHDIAVIMSIALRFIPILMEEVDKIMMAQKARGAAFDRGGLIKKAKALLPLLIPLFVSAFRRADELALALDARCYNATPNRTRYKELKLSFRDPIGVMFSALFIVAVIALNKLLWGLIPNSPSLWWLFY